MHEIELSTIYNESNMRTNQDVIMLIEQEKSRMHTILVKIYHVVMHVFLFSVFESIFFLVLYCGTRGKSIQKPFEGYNYDK